MLTKEQIEEVLIINDFYLSLPIRPKKYKVLPFINSHLNYPIYVKGTNRFPLVIHSDFLNIRNTLISISGVTSHHAQMEYFNSNMKEFDRTFNKGERPERYGLHFGFETIESLKVFLNTLNGDKEESDTKKTTSHDSDKETDGLSLVTTRIGHQALKEALHKYWDGCSVTGYQNRSLLIASHIIPWSEDKQSRLDLFNGLLLTPNLDALFDKGFISFNDNGEMLISEELQSKEYETLGLNHSLKLRKIEDQHRTYLKWHKENKFRT